MVHFAHSNVVRYSSSKILKPLVGPKLGRTEETEFVRIYQEDGCFLWTACVEQSAKLPVSETTVNPEATIMTTPL